MAEAISKAERYVHFEIYNLGSDKTGRKIAGALRERVKNGVHVRLVCDAVGSMDSDDDFFDELAADGIEFEYFRPLAPWRKRRGLLGRNHRKNLIIDGHTAFTGGMNVCDHFSVEQSGGKAWRDTHVRLQGPAAQACNFFFLETWEKVGGQKPPAKHSPDGDEKPAEQGESGCLVVGGRGASKLKAIRELYCQNFKNATEHVELSVPYFVPPYHLMRSLLDCADRGVRVDLLVPAESDIRTADWLRDGLYPRLLRHDVRIHEYEPSMLHAKTMSIDEQLSVIGSANFDHLSIAMNWELSVLIEDPEISKKMKAQFKKDLENSHLIPKDWPEKGPLYQRALARFASFANRKM